MFSVEIQTIQDRARINDRPGRRWEDNCCSIRYRRSSRRSICNILHNRSTRMRLRAISLGRSLPGILQADRKAAVFSGRLRMGHGPNRTSRERGPLYSFLPYPGGVRAQLLGRIAAPLEVGHARPPRSWRSFHRTRGPSSHSDSPRRARPARGLRSCLRPRASHFKPAAPECPDRRASVERRALASQLVFLVELKRAIRSPARDVGRYK